MKKRIIALLSTALILTGLVGCGQSSNKAVDASSSGDSGEKKVIYLGIIDDSISIIIYNELIL